LQDAPHETVPAVPPQPTGARNPRPLLIGIAVAVVALATVAFLMSRGGRHEMTGTVELVGNWTEGDIALDDYESISVGDSCYGLGGYDDMHQGAQVVIRDEAATVLATGSLGPGKVGEFADPLTSSE